MGTVVNKFIALSIGLKCLTGFNTMAFSQAPGSLKQLNPGFSFFLDGRITLDSLTKIIHRHTATRFSFNSVKVNGSTMIAFSRGNYTLYQILNKIKSSTSLYYVIYSGYIIFQSKPPTPGKDLTSLSPTKKNHAQKKVTAKETTTKSTPLHNGRISKEDLLFKDNAKPETLYFVKNSSRFVSSGSFDTKGQKNGVITTDTSLAVVANSTHVSDQKEKQSPDAINKKKLKRNQGHTLKFGIQWNFDIPYQNASAYLIAKIKKPTLLNLFFPSFSLAKKINDKYELSLLFKISQQHLMGSKTLAIESGPYSSTDTSLVQKKTNLILTNSTTAGIQIGYKPFSKFRINAGIIGYWQNNAMINKQTAHIRNSGIQTDSLYFIKKSSGDWKYFKQSFLSTRFEFTYQIKKIEIGTGITIPISSILLSPMNNNRPASLYSLLKFNF